MSSAKKKPLTLAGKHPHLVDLRSVTWVALMRKEVRSANAISKCSLVAGWRSSLSHWLYNNPLLKDSPWDFLSSLPYLIHVEFNSMSIIGVVSGRLLFFHSSVHQSNVVSSQNYHGLRLERSRTSVHELYGQLPTVCRYLQIVIWRIFGKSDTTGNTVTPHV